MHSTLFQLMLQMDELGDEDWAEAFAGISEDWAMVQRMGILTKIANASLVITVLRSVGCAARKPSSIAVANRRIVLISPLIQLGSTDPMV